MPLLEARRYSGAALAVWDALGAVLRVGMLFLTVFLAVIGFFLAAIFTGIVHGDPNRRR